MRSTKERILEKALESFAANGYNGTNLRDLAAELGLSKSALYKHFTSKEDIWNSLVDMMERYYRSHFGSPDRLLQTPICCRELLDISMKMLSFTMHDPKVILTRKVLLIEQFRDESVGRLATFHFLTGTEEIYTRIFDGMMQNGSLKKEDPKMLAFCYTAPISALIQLCDREPEKEPEIMDKIENFIRHFINTYGIK